MKGLLPILIPLLFSKGVVAQQYSRKLRAVNLIENHTYYINSQTNIGGKSRLSVPVRLPANTIAWYYSIVTKATSDKSDQLNSGESLVSQLTGFITKDILGISGANLLSNVAVAVLKPSGTAKLDVFLTNSKGLHQFEQKGILGDYAYPQPEYYREGTALNLVTGTYHINIVNNDLFLCLRNPDLVTGALVSLEIVAILAENIYDDIWTPSNKDLIYKNCLASFSSKSDNAGSLCSCYRTKVLATYTPTAYNQLTDAGRLSLYQEAIKECAVNGNLVGLLDNEKKIKELAELIQGQAVMKDYAGMEKSLLELISLDQRTWDNYNGLAYCQLALKKYAEARQSLTLGLSKAPENVLLLGNLASYYLLTGDYSQAVEIFKSCKNKKTENHRKFKTVAEEDLKEFERLGLGNEGFGAVRKELGIK